MEIIHIAEILSATIREEREFIPVKKLEIIINLECYTQ